MTEAIKSIANRVYNNTQNMDLYIDMEGYAKQVNLIYGLIAKFTDFNTIMINEIQDAEYNRLKSDNWVQANAEPEHLISAYSNIASYMKDRAREEKSVVLIAQYMVILFDKLIETGTLITKAIRENMKEMIDQTRADLKYASGNRRQ